MSIFDRRLLVITGKGGVGRTTLSASLAIAAARRGRRVCVAELSGGSAIPSLFGLPGRSFDVRRATDGVSVWSLTVPECLEDFGQRKLGLSKLVARVAHTRATRSFIDAVPGLHDLLQLGKIENLIREPLARDPHFDLYILDAPATGHGVTLLSAARSMVEIAKAGPFFDLAEKIRTFIADPSLTTAIVTTLPEALPVSESAELVAALRTEHVAVGALLANRCDPNPLPSGFSADELFGQLDRVRGAGALSALAKRAQRRCAQQHAALKRLSVQHPDIPILKLPRVPAERVAFRLADTLSEVIP